MSDSEFERYLAILSGLLRLDVRHRDEIAAELRDHLEERLTALLEAGFSRHKATLMALEEFGDAAGLAGEFVQIFRRQRRRWVMRMTVGSIAACVAIGLAVMAMWPENSRAPGVLRVLAQEQERPASVDPFGAEPPPALGIAAPGQAPFAAGTPPTPGPAAPQGSAVAHRAQQETTEPTTEANNDRTEQKLAKRLKAEYPQIPLMDAILDFSQKFDVEVIVNRKHIEESGKDLNDPSWAVDLNLKSIRGDMLLDLVLHDVGLAYTIRDGIIVITTPDELESTLEVRVYNCRDLVALMHENPAAAMGGMGMMGSMSGMMGGGPQGGFAGSSAFGGDGGAAAPGNAPAKSGGMRGMPGMSGMPGMPGMPGMQGGMAMPGMGSSSMGGMSMGMMPGAMPGSMGGGAGSGNSATGVHELDALINVLTSTVTPNSWGSSGGPGTIEPYYGGLLIVNNNPQAHRKIEKLLKMMRDASQQPPGAVVGDR